MAVIDAIIIWVYDKKRNQGILEMNMQQLSKHNPNMINVDEQEFRKLFENYQPAEEIEEEGEEEEEDL